MQAQAYEGYFDNGFFYTSGKKIRIPERRRVYVTVLDEPITDNENTEAWQEFLTEIKKIDDEPLTQPERVKIREIKV